MNIQEWENYIRTKFNVDKIENISELQQYLTNFACEDCDVEMLTEGQMTNDDFYAAYNFSEREFLNRDVITYNSGWGTTLVFISSIDGESISEYFVVGMNGFSNEDVKKFYEIVITPIGDGQSEMK